MSPHQALLESELQCELAGDVIHAADVSLGQQKRGNSRIPVPRFVWNGFLRLIYLYIST